MTNNFEINGQQALEPRNMVLAARDYPVLMGLFLLISIAVALMNFLTDITYPLVDPRIKYSR